MTKILEIRNKITGFAAEYDVYFTPLFRFLLAFITFASINSYIGYFTKLNNMMLIAILALVCCLLPVSSILWVSSFMILLHLYALSKESAIVGLLILMIIYLIYFRFAPKDGIAVLLTPLTFRMNIPYVMPMGCGLLRGPLSFLAIECGTIVYYFLAGIHQNASAIREMSADPKAGISDKIRLVLGNIYNNKEMYLVMMVFAMTAIAVYIVRLIKVDHAWTLAIITGILIQLLGLFVGYMMLSISNKTMWLLLGNIIALLFSFFLEFIFMDLDYSRVERVQFEDDDYYYYVKAVPKRMVAAPEKKVQHFGNTMVLKVPKQSDYSDISDDDEEELAREIEEDLNN